MTTKVTNGDNKPLAEDSMDKFAMEGLVDVLNRASEAYYNGNEIMTNKEWDEKFDQLKKLEQKSDLKNGECRYKYCHEVLIEKPKDLYVYASEVIYVPARNEIVYISEGSGDNLLHEDIAAGYVDYIYIEAISCDGGLSESDGGQCLLAQLFRDKYSSTKECIPDVLDFLYDDASLKYVVLQNERKSNSNK